jgi:5'-nucleotidase
VRTRRGLTWGALALAVGVLGACGGDDDADDGAEPGDDGTTTTAPAEVEPLRILVTNDDGVQGQGISDLVEALLQLDDVEVTVVAPKDDKSGTGGSTTEGELVGAEATLLSGAEAIAVDGFPADSVQYALDNVVEEPPHLVVSGINKGQNLGPIAAAASGTVGAARKAVSLGVPALAVSQGFAAEFDYATGVELTLEWIEEHREALLAGDVPTDAAANLNIPSCATGEVRGVVEVPTATADEGRDYIVAPANCASTAAAPKDDIDAYLNGYAPLAEVAP